MLRSRTIYLVTTALAAVGLVGAPAAGLAQNAPAPYAPAPYAQAPASGDPPARVGRLAVMEGTVSFHAGGDDHWSPATLNFPVTTGDAFWTEPQALAEIQVSGSSLWLSDQTELDVTALDDQALQASTPQGETYLHLRAAGQGETFTIQTPRGTVAIAADGRYDIVAGDTEHPTTLTVLDGAAQITGNNISLQVHANETASITGATTFEGTVGPATQDEFLRAMLRREQPPARAARTVAPPTVVYQMTGGQDLDRYGDWQSSPDYGQVWYPQVAADWVPYRQGRWNYVAPWGWTWCDNEPWGFAPFHYGRWIQEGRRWGWVPSYAGYGERERPVYAPALVTFFGVGGREGAGFGVGLGLGLGLGAAFDRGNIGWVPLGPREPYYPPYGVSRTYLNRVNITNIRNVTNIYNEVGQRRELPIDRYQNNRGATLVPAQAMAESRPIGSAFRRPNERDLGQARGLVDRAPIAPTARTIGLTPGVARDLRVPAVERRQAPGPQMAAGPGPERAHPGALPMLRQGNGRPMGERAPMVGAPAIRTPASERAVNGTGLPPLRSPGARPPSEPRITGPSPAGEPRADRGPRGGQPPNPQAPGPQLGRGPIGSDTHPGLRAPGSVPPGARTPIEPGAPTPRPLSQPQGSAAPAPMPRHHVPPPAPAQFQPQPQPEPRAQPMHQQTAPMPRPMPQARPEPRPQPQPVPRPQLQPRPEPRPMPQPQPMPRPQPQPRPEPRPMPQARPEPRPQPAPPRPQPQPGQPQHEPKHPGQPGG